MPQHKEELEDPFHHGVPGFIAQLLHSGEYMNNFQPIFSVYLSNDEASPGRITFGGYDLGLAQQGKNESHVFWADQSKNEQYWAVNGREVKFGNKTIENKVQQLILDNGMSLTNVPKTSFLPFVESLLEEYRVMCQPR